MDTYASLGLEILKRATLQVLYQAHLQARHPLAQPYLGLNQVRERIGLIKVVDPTHHSNALIRGILDYLRDDRYVEFLLDNRWQITEAGIAVIEAEGS